MTWDFGLHSPCSSRRLEAQRRGGCQLENTKRRHVRKTITYCPNILLKLYNYSNVDPNIHILQKAGAMNLMPNLNLIHSLATHQWCHRQGFHQLLKVKYQLCNLWQGCSSECNMLINQQLLWTIQNNFNIPARFQVNDSELGHIIDFESRCSTLWQPCLDNCHPSAQCISMSDTRGWVLESTKNLLKIKK